MGEELKAFFEKHVTLEPGAWEDFKQNIIVRNLKKNEHFLSQGEICKRIGFIVKGYVRVYFLANGEEITKDFNFENSFCGSYASFSQRTPSRFNVIAMEEVIIYTISSEALFHLFDKYPSFQKMGRLSIEYMFIRKEQREASFLLDSAKERYGELISLHPSIAQRIPLKYLASYLGIRAETLSRLRGRR